MTYALYLDPPNATFKQMQKSLLHLYHCIRIGSSTSCCGRALWWNLLNMLSVLGILLALVISIELQCIMKVTIVFDIICVVCCLLFLPLVLMISLHMFNTLNIVEHHIYIL